MHFAEIRYQRPTGVEVCAILLPCLWEVSLAHLQVVSPSNPASSTSPERPTPLSSSSTVPEVAGESSFPGGEGESEVQMDIDSPDQDDMAVLDSPPPTSSLENTPVHPASREAFSASEVMGSMD